MGCDTVWHIPVCAKIGLAFKAKWPRCWLPSDDVQARSYFCLLDKPIIEEALKRIVIGDMMVKAYQALDGVGNNAAKIVKSIDARIAHWLLSRKGPSYDKITERIY